MIAMNDFRSEPAELRAAMTDAVRRVFESGWYILGQHCQAFEEAWARECGVQHGVGVANGMDAIEIALRSLHVGPGDEVITTPMTAFASVLAILRAGATPVLADIEPGSALLSIDSAKRCISPRTRAVVLVHLYGQLAAMDRWSELCSTAGINLIEDCAQSHLASLGGRVCGSFGRAAAFSFYPTKNLGAIGDGGMLLTNDTLVAERSRMLRNYGQSERYHHPVLGLNSRLDEIQAAILAARSRWLPEFMTRRRQVAQLYYTGIRNPAVRLPPQPVEPDAHVWHLFVVTCPNRDALAAHLLACGIQTFIHYPIAVHHQRSCADLARDPFGLPCTELHAKTCLSLPCHPQLSDEQVHAVIDAVNGFKG